MLQWYLICPIIRQPQQRSYHFKLMKQIRKFRFAWKVHLTDETRILCIANVNIYPLMFVNNISIHWHAATNTDLYLADNMLHSVHIST